MNKTYIRGRETPTGVKFKVKIGDQRSFEEIPFNTYFVISDVELNNKKPLILDESKHILKIVPHEEIPNHHKIILVNNLSRYKLKSKLELKGVELLEADIPSHKRWLIDTNIPLNQKKLNWLYYDIETKDDSNFDKDIRGGIIANEPILTIAYKDNQGNKFFIKNKNKNDPIQGEVDLLLTHKKIMKEFDCILAWNGKLFDDTYVKQRTEFHNMSLEEWDFINQLDYMEVVKSCLFPQIPSYSLNNVSKHILGSCKLEGFEAGNGNVLKAWLDSFDGDYLLQKYNELDVELMYEIEKKLNFIPLLFEQAEIAKCFVQETMHNSELWDMLLLRQFKQNGLPSPTKPNTEQTDIRKKQGCTLGAYTFCLNPGVHDNVDVFDFKSFYPTTADANNICPTTLISKEEAEEKGIPYVTIPEDIHTVNISSTKNPFLMDIKKSGECKNNNFKIVEMDKKELKIKVKEKYFRLDKRGIMADLFGFFISERDKTKYIAKKEKDPTKRAELKSKENSYKILANSGYGVLGLSSFRYYDERISNAITQFCRFNIKKCINKAEEMGFNVVQGDTDSIMFSNRDNKHDKNDLEYEFYLMFQEVAKQQNIKSKKFMLINPKTKELEENDHFIVFEHEKTFLKMLAVVKKQYVDLKVDYDGDGNPIGEPKFSVTGLECIKKDTNKLAVELQKRLCEDILRERFSENNLLANIEQIKGQLLKNTLDTKYLIMSKSLNKPLEEYGQPTIDSKTGLPKIKKDGSIQYSPIPAHVKLAKRLMDEGKNIFVGDQINYIVKEQKPIVAISLEEYKNGEDFEREYYWERIITPVMKILFITHPKLILDNAQLWSIKELDEKKLQKYINKLEKSCLIVED